MGWMVHRSRGKLGGIRGEGWGGDAEPRPPSSRQPLP